MALQNTLGTIGEISPYPVVQLAWAVDDIATGINQWAALTGAGPFFTMAHVPLLNVEHRGRPSSLDHSTAIGWWGSIELELMQRHCDQPSPLREMFPNGGAGFASASWFAPDLEAETRRLEALGFPLCWKCDITDDGMAALWFDTRPVLGAMVEIFPEHPAMREIFARIEKAAAGWTGERPMRPMEEIM